MRHLGQPASDAVVPEPRDSSATAVGTPGLIGLEGFGPAPAHARVRLRGIRTLLANTTGALLAWRSPAGAGPPVPQRDGVALGTARVVVADRAIDRPRRMPGTGVRHRNALRLSPADREARRGDGQEIARASWCTFGSDTGPGYALCSSPGCVRGQGYRRSRTADRNVPEARSGPGWGRTDSWWCGIAAVLGPSGKSGSYRTGALIRACPKRPDDKPRQVLVGSCQDDIGLPPRLLGERRRTLGPMALRVAPQNRVDSAPC